LIHPETDRDVLAEIRDALERIARTLESFANAAIHHPSPDSDGQIDVVVHSLFGKEWK
jgi:hypothetical protein